MDRSMFAVNNHSFRDDDRSCRNCVHVENCWRDFIIEREDTSHCPVRFVIRSSWRDRSLSEYMKTIWGGLCENFQHPNQEVNASFQATERRRVDELPAGDWDK